MTATGLHLDQVRALNHDQQVTLNAWHHTVAGDSNGRPWLPQAIRNLTIEQRLDLAVLPDRAHDWRRREVQRVFDDVAYFIAGYGHVRTGNDDDPGPPIPFDLWPEQAQTLDLFQRERRVVVLKARQLGLTWLALHYAYHLAAFHPAGGDSIILCLSQDGGYAKHLLHRLRDINDLLPPFLRHDEDRETRHSKTEFKLAARGRFASLAGTASAARSYQADLAIFDEAAFVRHGLAAPTMTALLPAARQVLAISTGQGGPDDPGDGQYFARLYTRAAAGQSEWAPVFLPTSVRPGRDEAWRERERDDYDTDEKFLAEHPETPDDALIGAGKDRFFRLADLNAAVALGGQLDRLLGTEHMPDPVGGAIRTCADYGDVMTQGYVVWPLEGGGFYVPPSELAMSQAEGAEIAARLHQLAAEVQQVDPVTGHLDPPIEQHRFDSAGVQTNRSYLTATLARHRHQWVPGDPHFYGARFNRSKRETAGYLRRLLKRTGQGRTTGVIAISPANGELVRQWRGLESAADGLWKKTDDHGVDAIVAGVSDLAKRYRDIAGH